MSELAHPLVSTPAVSRQLQAMGDLDGAVQPIACLPFVSVFDRSGKIALQFEIVDRHIGYEPDLVLSGGFCPDSRIEQIIFDEPENLIHLACLDGAGCQRGEVSLSNAMSRVEDKLSFRARARAADLGDDLVQLANHNASIEKLKPRRVTHPIQHFALDCQQSRSFGIVKADDRSGGAGKIYPVLPERYGRRRIEKVVVGAERAVGNMDTGFETAQPVTLSIVTCSEDCLLGNGSMDDAGLMDQP
ncbi:hypothetical protein [Rhizobium leguminosarum]|uniref:hypothetical protein n=1 Tax=Rhizobium leguminosarum TaxID=384 RepID=UPI001FE1B0F2|nr:hypothetical protein [Rhizobium leguminosarum]